MSFAAHSHPEREAPMQRNGAEYLRDLRERISAIPDACVPSLPCPLCGDALSVTQGRRSGVWFVEHSGGTCGLAGDNWRITAATREAAIEQWRADFAP